MAQLVRYFLGKYDNLPFESLEPTLNASTTTKPRRVPTIHVMGGGGKQISGAYWLAGLAKSASFGFIEAPCLNKYGGGAGEVAQQLRHIYSC